MAKIAFFVLSVIGMTNIIVDSTLFAPIRDSVGSVCKKCHSLITCHQCTGFWCGMLCGWIVISHDVFWVLLSGCAGSFLASAYTIFSDFIISKTDFVIGDDDAE